MRRQLHGKRVLVTGASSGIGRALAEKAAAAGMRILMTARSSDPLEELAGSLAAKGYEAVALPADITVPEDRRRLLQTALDRFGGLDVLVNNAGVGTQGCFTDSSEAVLRQIMEVNFFASAEMIRLAVPLLEGGRQPAIVQVASMCGRRSMPFWSEYSASKFAVCGLIEALRPELVRFGLDVLLILPGVTQTNLGNNLLHTDGQMAFKFENGMKPEYVAGKILRALASNRAETVIGLEAQWLIRANRWIPRIVDAGLARYVRKRYGGDAKL
jgi:short-subunit dehydrogenase